VRPLLRRCAQKIKGVTLQAFDRIEEKVIDAEHRDEPASGLNIGPMREGVCVGRRPLLEELRAVSLPRALLAPVSDPTATKIVELISSRSPDSGLADSLGQHL